MRRRFLCALIVCAATTPATGQVAPPAPPSVDARDRLVAASGTMPDGGEVQLLIDGEHAWLRWRAAGLSWWAERSLDDNTRLALAVLADRRVDFLWPALLAWAGDDLGLMRARMVARAEQALAGAAPDDARNTLESTVRPRTRALLQLASVLFRAGYPDRARRLMEQDLAGRNLTSMWDRTEWVMVKLRIAQQLMMLGRSADAIDLLRLAAAQPGIPASLIVNFDVNRAVFLANAGHYGEALSVIDAARKTFGDKKVVREGGLDRIDGSARQFAWIKGCALQGLGRPADAAQWLDYVRTAREPADPWFVTESNGTLRYRVQLCTHDTAGLLDDMIHSARATPFAPDALLIAQPAARWPGDPGGTIARAGMSHALRAVVQPWMRVLPTALVPALNGWRD